MLQTRVIPVLLLKNRGLVKTIKFQSPRYVGDPINAVRIFNEKEVDELIFLDIEATSQNREPDYELVGQIAREAFMPLCYGGGVKTLDQVKKLFSIGIEKVVLNSAAFENPNLVTQIANFSGAQSVAVSLDIRRDMFGKYSVWRQNGKHNTKLGLVEAATQMQERGAGEIFINSIDRDGTRSGYELKAIQQVAAAVKIPVIACGGAGTMQHFLEAKQNGASALAAGSMFVFHGKHQAVLITYPRYEDIRATLEGAKT